MEDNDIVDRFLKDLKKRFARRKILLVQAHSDPNKETLEVSGKQLNICWFPKLDVFLRRGTKETNTRMYNLLMKKFVLHIRKHLNYTRSRKIKK